MSAQTMKAVRLVEPGRPLEMQEIAIPPLGPGDVRVRIKAAGICHSDAHYRAGTADVEPLPLTLGHEVAGIVEEVGSHVSHLKTGDRVCLHYMVTCGHCDYCNRGSEQFCTSGAMLGKYRDGGYAEYIVLSARSASLLPDDIPFEQGAIMMCSSATSLHALHKANVQAGESVAIFGVGGLGIPAVQLAGAFGAGPVFAVDIKAGKLEMAQQFGATPINASEKDPVAEIMRLTSSRGVDVALELIGLPLTMKQAVQSLAVFGRAALVGLTGQTFEIAPYADLLKKEAQVIGVADHLAQEIPQLIHWVQQGQLTLSGAISETVPLEADAINHVLDRLEQFSDEVRVVITP